MLEMRQFVPYYMYIQSRTKHSEMCSRYGICSFFKTLSGHRGALIKQFVFYSSKWIYWQV